MKQFDLISDTHIDFWLGNNGTAEEGKLHEIDLFVDSLLPQEISKVLVIAGDLGHDNEQNFHFLSSLKRYYEHILLVAGNHDYYLVNKNQRSKHQTSMERWSNMKALGTFLDGVQYLDGDICEIDGIRYGGTGMWYDFSYGVQVLGRSLSSMAAYWAYRMNDGKHTIGLPSNTLEMYAEEKKKLDTIIHDSDVIITHVSPDWSHIAEEDRIDTLTGCYYFDGSEYMNQIDGKIWCSGHIHLKHSYIHEGCYFVNNALGYPGENKRRKIANIPIDRK